MQTAILRKNGIISAEQTINLVKSKVPFYQNEGADIPKVANFINSEF